jgi:two-component system secretion response regulator SsrB
MSVPPPTPRPDDACRCVLLAERHAALSEGVRGLLSTVFEAVVIVADEASLIEGAARLKPAVAVVDLSLDPGAGPGWIGRLRARCPDLKLVVLSAYDEPVARELAAAAGGAFVLSRAIATDLLPAIDGVLADRPRGSASEADVPPPA